MNGLRSVRLVCLALISLLLVLPASVRAEGRVQGRVTNGTTGKALADQPVRLLLPRGGMQQVATVTTDASGRFVFPSANIDISSFYLIQTTYKGVDYNAPAQFDSGGTADASITVYEASSSAPPLRIQSARVVVQAEGDKAHVQEMLAFRNTNDPPRSYANSNGTIRFRLSPDRAEPHAAVAGLMNMPLPQPISPGKAPGEYLLQCPLKPGLTVVMVAYDVDYSSNRLVLGDSYPYPIDRAELLVSPPSLTVDSPLFKPAGADADTGSQKYVAAGLQSQTKLEARLSGEVVRGESGEAAQADTQVKVLPNPIIRLGGPLLACFLLVLMWALGVRLAKEWPRFSGQRRASQTQKDLEAKVEALFNSLADLDELFAAGKVAEKQYWKERLDLKARLTASLKKASPSLLESYATRHASSR